MIQFILNNKTIQTSEKSGKTLLDFIRDTQQLKGTKIGCREGDCGACTVLIGTLIGDEISYKSITSCISPLGNVNGKHIVTVEGVNLKKNLNVVQEAMAVNFATQCGFCTPGFVVSLTGYALNSCGNTQIDAISGNICRCTGYKSIEKAANTVEEKLISRNIKDLINEGFVPEYFETIPKRLKEIKPQNLKIEISDKAIVANGTDLYVRHADHLTEQEVQLVGEIPLLKGIKLKDGVFTIGASTTVTEILEHKELKNQFPNLKAHLKLVSSEPIRNMGTLSGNFVNASPIGDMSIFFLALNSSLIINGIAKEREILFQDFHQDYKKYDLKDDELITAISFNKLTKNTKFNFEKVSKRTHLDIATVNTACRIMVENNIIKEAYFSVGGVAAIPKFLEETNQFLIGKEISRDSILEAEKIMQSEISPISDVRGTNIYKRLLARQLFFAHFIKLFPKQIKLQELI